MLSVFKQLWKNRYHPTVEHKLPIFTVCESIKPISNVAFEDAESLLETAYDWLTGQSHSHSMRNLGHFPLLSVYSADRPYFESPYANTSLNTLLVEELSYGATPMVITNCHETLLNLLPSLIIDSDQIGIININADFLMDQTLEVKTGSMLHFALNRHNECRAFHIGIDPNAASKSQLDYAEDMGCDWALLSEVNYRNKGMIKSQVARFLHHCDKVIITIDLPSISKTMSKLENQKLELSMVLRILRQCMSSNKTTLIQLVGNKEEHIYSASTQLIVEQASHFYYFSH
ncbi:hypothetical protein [Vibrio nomapromontoriensis]|uniref:hypothetical protein n=1 Tax=Vibrio nomapromontoriensis TaxID=2910246 RepID=UPI003D0CFB0A